MADKSHTEERLVVVGSGGVGKTAPYFQFTGCDLSDAIPRKHCFLDGRLALLESECAC